MRYLSPLCANDFAVNLILHQCFLRINLRTHFIISVAISIDFNPKHLNRTQFFLLISNEITKIRRIAHKRILNVMNFDLLLS